MTTRPSPTRTPEPASFRDPEARVVYSADGEVLRELSSRAREDWDALESARFFRRALEDRRIVATEEVEPGLLRHERLPFVSYPYEWPFEMLRDAALLQLGLLDEALSENFVLKDGSPYNVQWRGTEAVFVDIGSFERLREGEPWAGYRQFCALFLYPLMLQAYRGIAPQPFLRGSLEGIEPSQARALLPRFRRGVLTHVVLHDRLEARHADRKRDVRSELKAAGFKKELIQANVRKLRKLVTRLSPKRGRSEWAGYREAAPYSDEDADRKERFVRSAGSAQLAWDLGANDGRFSRALDAQHVVAVDGDERVVGELYASLRAEESKTILPLVVDLADASPARGWRGVERRRLEDRGRPDLVLCLALVHHLAIGRNVPFTELIGWLRGLGGRLVIEFADRDDPMVKRLLAAKRAEVHESYGRDEFERALRDGFAIERSEELGSGTRTLYLAKPRP
jgi:SAM-dependent methyltransferase